MGWAAETAHLALPWTVPAHTRADSIAKGEAQVGPGIADGTMGSERPDDGRQTQCGENGTDDGAIGDEATDTAPTATGQARTSWAKTRRNRSAHGRRLGRRAERSWHAEGVLLDRCRGACRPGWSRMGTGAGRQSNDPGAQTRAGGEHTGVADQVMARRRGR